VEERGGDRLLVEAETRADGRDSDRMRDERLAGPPRLSLVRGGGEPEGSGDERGVDVRPLRGDLGEQRFEELFVPLACLQSRHFLSVLAGFYAFRAAGTAVE
jgi:hypothetical protein